MTLNLFSIRAIKRGELGLIKRNSQKRLYSNPMGKPVRESGSMSTLVLACLVINLAKINVFHVKQDSSQFYS